MNETVPARPVDLVSVFAGFAAWLASWGNLFFNSPEGIGGPWAVGAAVVLHVVAVAVYGVALNANRTKVRLRAMSEGQVAVRAAMISWRNHVAALVVVCSLWMLSGGLAVHRDQGGLFAPVGAATAAAAVYCLVAVGVATANVVSVRRRGREPLTLPSE